MIGIIEIVVLMAVIISQTNLADGYAVDSSDNDGKQASNVLHLSSPTLWYFGLFWSVVLI